MALVNRRRRGVLQYAGGGGGGDGGGLQSGGPRPKREALSLVSSATIPLLAAEMPGQSSRRSLPKCRATHHRWVKVHLEVGEGSAGVI